ncbi:hypothetical protein ACTMTJ_21645 [Phytohabitans sp. LJ34]|uniref:hypothetical protein n=1 Tax=Phytohabitans sp. LJ34 TaxID=3452217 RepID=UPI003F8B063B
MAFHAALAQVVLVDGQLRAKAGPDTCAAYPPALGMQVLCRIGDGRQQDWADRRLGSSGTEQDMPTSSGRPTRWRKLVTVLVAINAIAAAGVVAAASPASAIEGLRFIPASSNSDSSTLKTLRINCPTGARGLGGDMSITGSTQVRIHRIRPFNTGVEFAATEPEEGVPGDWSFTAKAICAPAASLPGLQIITDVVRADVLARGEPVIVNAVARCPGRTGAIGMGAEARGLDTATDTDPTSKIHLTKIDTLGPPGEAGDYGSGTAVGAGFEGFVQVTATAICVSFDQVPSLTWNRDETARNSTGDKQISTTCPQGTTVHGGGFATNWTTVERTGAHLGATQLRVDTDVLATVRESTAGTPNAWSLFAVAICA